MDILFNYNNTGTEELKEILGFLDADFNFDNLQTDIELTSPELESLIGKAVYQKLVDYYTSNDDDVVLTDAVKLARIYIASFAYLDYAANGDLTHGNAGRSVSNEDKESVPYEYQIARDDAALKSRAYKALDRLFNLLNSQDWEEWTTSEQYLKSQSLLVKNAFQFKEIYMALDSPQMYYRLTPFLAEIEQSDIIHRIGQDVYDLLPTTTNVMLLKLKDQAQRAVVYKAIAKAYKTFPIEMFPDKVNFRNKENAEIYIREKMYAYLDAEAAQYLLKVEYYYTQYSQTFETINTMPGLTDGTKYVSL